MLLQSQVNGGFIAEEPTKLPPDEKNTSISDDVVKVKDIFDLKYSAYLSFN